MKAGLKKGDDTSIPQPESLCRMAKPLGDRLASGVAKMASQHITNIKAILSSGGKTKSEFDCFMIGLRNSVSPSITEQDAIEMLAQHIVMQPVFEALFDGHSFVQNNAVSLLLQRVVSSLSEHSAVDATQTVESFGASVRIHTGAIDSRGMRQQVIAELYNQFFRAACPNATDKLGIVYTPVEIVDFVIHSVEDVLRKEFDRSMSDENVHVMDPFTGTGMFVTRLLQSDIIRHEDLTRKYFEEIHAIEMVPLAYYVASMNVEAVYRDMLLLEAGSSASSADEERCFAKPEHAVASAPCDHAKSFRGLRLADTFEMADTGPFDRQSASDSERSAPLWVVMGNPPYSIGQRSANRDARNKEYPKLEKRIAETYVAASEAGLSKAAYDTYIKAFRWASDWLGTDKGGIVGFVSNASWLDAKGLDGFRRCLEREFSSIYVFNLRGNCRTMGEIRRREGGNVFGLGSRTPVAICLLVRRGQHAKNEGPAEIHYRDIGDFLPRKAKLTMVREARSMLDPTMAMTRVTPNSHGDWIRQRSDAFGTFIPLQPRRKLDTKSHSFFSTYAIGVATNKDAWMHSFSRRSLRTNMKEMVDCYNCERKKLHSMLSRQMAAECKSRADANRGRISWTVKLKRDLKNNVVHKVSDDSMRTSLYRPFAKTRLCYDVNLVERPGIWRQILPTENCDNTLLMVPGPGDRKGFCALVAKALPDLGNFDGGTQCFPLYWYEEKRSALPNVPTKEVSTCIQHSAITDFIHTQAKHRYGANVTQEDIFYYVYGVLHSPTYRQTFANDLKKTLPSLPLVEHPQDFWSFASAGRELADLHLNYDSRPPPESVLINGKPASGARFSPAELVVKKMAFPSKGQRDRIVYNSHITVSCIPEHAYEYIVNGKSAIEWVMERYAVTVHRDSGIVNDPNAWGLEQRNPRYVLDLLLSMITVSIETMEIVARLPTVRWK